MKNYLIIFFIIFAQVLNAQIIQSSCSAPDSIILRYTPFAEQLVVRELYANSNQTSDTNIPLQEKEKFLNALIALYNANIPESDTVTKMGVKDNGQILPFGSSLAYPMSIKNSISMNTITIFASPNYTDWMMDLKQGNIITNNTRINEIISNYNFTIQYTSLSTMGIGDDMVVFKTTDNYYLKPLVDEIAAMSGVSSVSCTPALVGDGNNISHITATNYIELIISFGWEDCLAGCGKERFWKFKIYNDCSVEFIESYGSLLSVPPTNIVLNKDTLIFNQITVDEYLTKEFIPNNSIFTNVVWESLDPNVATVTSYGKVTSTGFGTTKIIAKVFGSLIVDTCIVYVLDEVALANVNLIGDDAFEDSTITYTLDIDYPLGTTFIWSVENGNIIGSNTNDSVNVYWLQINNQGIVSVSIVLPNQTIFYKEYDIIVLSNSINIISNILNDVNISPNPCLNFIKINGINREFEYTIIDMSGKEILKGKSKNISTIKIESLIKGEYFLLIKVDNYFLKYKILKQ